MLMIDGDYKIGADYSVLDDVAEEKLKPCPFCGGKAIIIKEQDIDDPVVETLRVGCKNCGVQTDYHYNEKYAIKEWNRRINEG